MKINDLDKLLEEGRHEEAVDMLLKEIGEEEGTEVVEEPVNEPNEEEKEAKLETPEVEEEAKEEEHKDEEEKSEEAEENKEESGEKEEEKEEINEDAMEIEPAAIDAVKDGTAEIEDLLSDDNGNADELKEVPAGETVEQAEEILDKKVPEVDIDTQISESLNSIFALLKGLNEEAGNEATEEKEPAAETPEVENEDVFPAEEHKEVEEIKEPELKNEDIYNSETEPVDAEEVKEVVVEEAGNEATEEKEPAAETPELDNEDIYNKETEPVDVEEVKEVVVENDMQLSEASKAVKRIAKGKGKPGDSNAMLEPGFDDEIAAYTSGKEAAKHLAIARSTTDENKRDDEVGKARGKVWGGVYSSETSKQENQPKGYVKGLKNRLKVSKKKGDQLAVEARERKLIGAKINARRHFLEKIGIMEEILVEGLSDSDILSLLEEAGLEASLENLAKVKSGDIEIKEKPEEEAGNEATEAREPEVKKQDLENKDIYCDVMHKQVEDVVAVVVEAAKLCKEAGVAGTIENITEMAKSLFEAEEVAVKVEKPENEPKEEEYDVDAAIESSEMNGNKEEFEKYEEIQGEGSEAAKAEESVVEPKDLQETVKYTSLKEACMLDEAYFTTDSYSIQTAAEKQAKLNEQVALLLARESADPLYNELLKNSVYCRRLQEALLEKYSDEAAVRSSKILGK